MKHRVYFGGTIIVEGNTYKEIEENFLKLINSQNALIIEPYIKDCDIIFEEEEE